MSLPWSLIPPRHHEPELMDAPGLPEAEVAAAYQVLRRVNRQLGNTRSMRHELDRLLTEDLGRDRDAWWSLSSASSMPGAPVRLLDLGSGSGDIPRDLAARLRCRSIDVQAVALDHDPTAVRLCRAGAVGELSVVRGDALRLPFGDGSIDLVAAVKFAHHFHGAGLDRLVDEMARVARHRVVVLDIRRHWLAYWGFVAWSRLWTRNRLVRYDGPLSVLRGFTSAELLATAGPSARPGPGPAAVSAFRWTIRRYAGFQIALVGRRMSRNSEKI